MLTDFRPPKHDVLQVRALVDCGDVAVKWGGFRRINKGEIVSLSRVDAEPFILKGMASCTRARERITLNARRMLQVTCSTLQDR